MTESPGIKLHLGYGRNTLPGWVNLNTIPGIGDSVADLEKCKDEPLPFPDESVEEFLISHVLEHITNVLPLLQELHRIAKPNAKMVASVPYGSSDDAFEDPTCVRRFFPGSFAYFSQPGCWQFSQGYRGDWDCEKVTLRLAAEKHLGKPMDQIVHEVEHYRNVVKEMVVELRAVKPIRPADPLLQTQLNIEVAFV